MDRRWRMEDGGNQEHLFTTGRRNGGEDRKVCLENRETNRSVTQRPRRLRNRRQEVGGRETATGEGGSYWCQYQWMRTQHDQSIPRWQEKGLACRQTSLALVRSSLSSGRPTAGIPHLLDQLGVLLGKGYPS